MCNIYGRDFHLISTELCNRSPLVTLIDFQFLIALLKQISRKPRCYNISWTIGLNDS